MVIPAAVFVGVVAIILGAYWLFVVRQEERLLGRLAPSRPKGQRLVRDMVKAEEQTSSVGKAIERQPWAGNLQLRVEQSGLKLSVGSLLLMMVGCGIGGYLLTVFLSRQPLLGLGVGFVLTWVPYWYVGRARFKRMLKFEEQFPESIDLIARALRAGHALPTGLSMVADEMPAPVGTEFRLLYDEQNFGLTLPDALRNFARRIPVLDARFFVTAVLTQRESGGNLAEVLDNLASVIRDRFKVKRQVRVISAHGRITGWVLALLPPSLAMATLIINPEHLGTLTGDPLGRQMIVVAVSLQVIGTLIIRKIVDVEDLMSGPLILAVVGVFGTVALVVGAVTAYTLASMTPERRRLQRLGQATPSGVLLDGPSLTPEPSQFVQRVTSFIPKSPKEVTRLRKRFMRAGYHTLTPLAVYSLGQVVLPVILGGSALLLLTPPASWVFGAAGALIGYLLPSLVLERLIAKRQKVIQNGLPDALDLMIVCLEAGSAIDQAILKVSDELGIAYPALAEEFRMIITETRAGKPRLEAFRNFASRTGVDDVRALVAMLVQTDRFGTSVSQALRTHAETSRTKRRQRAEERAAKIGVKLVFPLVFALFPAFFVVTLGPAVIRFIRVLFGQVLGQ